MNKHQAMNILTDIPLSDLEVMCSTVRQKKFNNRVDLCAILNTKNGSCTEDCAFCAQSHSIGQPMLNLNEILAAHKEVSEAGINRFSMVTSGRTLPDEELKRICEAAEIGRQYSPICASLGILELPQLQKLQNAGVSRYHHNLETSESFFPSVCTTHSWSDRVETVRNVKLAGLSVCSGGIMGIGESDSDRIDLAFTLKDLAVESIALNFYLPVEGARVKAEYLSPEKLLRIIAMFRLVNPSSELRICAGRAGLEMMGDRMFSFGVTGIMTGILLTTMGSQLEEDLDLIQRTGFKT